MYTQRGASLLESVLLLAMACLMVLAVAGVLGGMGRYFTKSQTKIGDLWIPPDPRPR